MEYELCFTCAEDEDKVVDAVMELSLDGAFGGDGYGSYTFWADNKTSIHKVRARVTSRFPSAVFEEQN